MKIFIDTSVLFPLFSTDDADHDRVERLLRGLEIHAPTLVSTNYVLVECLALLQRREGLDPAAQLLKFATSALRVIWLDEARHEAARREWERSGKRDLSFVDCASFVAMREEGITEALAFDRHFQEAGFRLAGGSFEGEAHDRRTRYRASRKRVRRAER